MVKKVYLISLIVLLMVLNTVIAFAAIDDDTISKYVASETKIVNGDLVITDNKIRTWLHEDSTGIDDINILTVSVDGISKTYYMSDNEKIALTRHLEKKIEGYEVDNKILQMADGFNVEADVTEAAQMLSGFHGLVSLIAGLLAYAAVLGMGIFTSFDVMYIVLPIFRNRMHDSANSGNKLIGKQEKMGT